jgi:hypothetical protein
MRMAKTPYWLLERNVGEAFFRLVRTTEAYQSLDLISQSFQQLEKAILGVDVSRLGFLVDLRLGPMRNDPAFEATARPWQEKVMKAFARVAILVKTPAGKLQMSRIVRSLHATAQVFDDEKTAVAHLTVKS